MNADRLKKLLIEAAVPPFLAAGFWLIIVLMVIVATAEGKDGHFTAFFAAFGAVGQTFFAFVVWQLSREQFAFTKRIAERQTRIELLEPRKKAYDHWLELSGSLTRDYSEEYFTKLLDFHGDLTRLFPRAAAQAFDALTDVYVEMMDFQDTVSSVALTTEGFASRRAEQKALQEKVGRHRLVVHRYIRDAINVEVD